VAKKNMFRVYCGQQLLHQQEQEVCAIEGKGERERGRDRRERERERERERKRERERERERNNACPTFCLFVQKSFFPRTAAERERKRGRIERKRQTQYF
jgi:hypothetical protein